MCICIVFRFQCDPGAGIDRYFHALYSKKIVTMLLGTACSNVTESLASIVPYWNILQVQCEIVYINVFFLLNSVDILLYPQLWDIKHSRCRRMSALMTIN